MTLLGFEIQTIPLWRMKPSGHLFILFAVAGICTSAMRSDYFVSYRLGDSIIPREDQLIRTGPYMMDTTKIRNGIFVLVQRKLEFSRV
ncbi:MAG: hypothetical protein P4L69_17450 [Desulfosporosinus sp.]|nr:hypothetical protein [Desulfosporosinus sp.]